MTTPQLQRLLDARLVVPASSSALLRRLQRQRLVHMSRVAAAFHEPNEVLTSRTYGQAEPPFETLAWQLEQRWRHVKSRRVTICWATSATARRYGGLAAFERRRTQLEHDLGTAAVLIRLHETQPDLADRWLGEDLIRRDFSPYCPAMKKVPDGAVVENGRVVRVVEYCGNYSAQRLRHFDAHFFAQHRLPYDLW